MAAADPSPSFRWPGPMFCSIRSANSVRPWAPHGSTDAIYSGSWALPRAFTHRRAAEYEVRCLLRWPLLSAAVWGTDFRQVWHIDSDMLFYASLEELARDTAGKTFILQGCPAFSSISNRDGLTRAGAGALEDTGEPGFRVTREMRAGIAREMSDWANSSVYRIPLTQDQDLIECLVGEGRMPQDLFPVVLGDSFYYMQNPLCLRVAPCGVRVRALCSKSAAMRYASGRAACRSSTFRRTTRFLEAYRRATGVGLAGATRTFF